jgi:hypothetical protein
VDSSAISTRDAALSSAAAGLDAELMAADVDEYFTLILRACARGGGAALQTFCDRIEHPATAIDEAPVVALLAALPRQDCADRAVRAVAWAMAAHRVAETWPGTFYGVLEVARVAMPVGDYEFERMQILGSLTAGALRTAESDERDGMRVQFIRESLEHVIAAATGQRPARQDMLLVIPPWTAAFIRGIRTCDEHLRELEALHPEFVPAAP